MQIKQANGFFFSPTGTTRTLTEAVAEGVSAAAEVSAICVDVTERAFEGVIDADVLTVVGVPVFAGRVPPTAVARLEALQGNGAPVIAVVVYGNRAYEDALVELVDVLAARGFNVVAAGAFVARHSIVIDIAEGRPDIADIEAATSLGWQVVEKLRNQGLDQASTLEVPGNRPYKEYKPLPMHPSAGRACTACGACAKACPVGAIPEQNPKRTEANICISCMRCVVVCPYNARALNPLERKGASMMLHKVCKERKTCELFV